MKLICPVGLRWFVAGGCVLLAASGCRTRTEMPRLPMPPPAGGGGGGSVRTAPAAPLDLSAGLLRDLSVPLNWLELDVFFPPGARRVGVFDERVRELSPENRMRFPTAELYPSPDAVHWLYHDGVKRTRKEVTHWLMLYRKEAPFPTSIFCTSASFDATWSPDSRLFAVTHYYSSNISEVFISDTNYNKETVSLRPFVEANFPPHFASSSLAVRAHRWTAESELIVRAIGRAEIEPYELFGCEILVRFPGAGKDMTAHYLRGFVRGGEARMEGGK